jgi:methylenetetrahydrofolate reductase (NADPH)
MNSNLDFLNKIHDRIPVSLEILPPNRGLGLDAIHSFFEGLKPWKPAFVSVTYHQAFKVEENETRIWNRKKPGTIGVCAMLKFQYDLKVIPHVICGGFSSFESEDFLVDLDYLGLDTILALRGDPKKGDDEFRHHQDGHRYASELVEQVMRLNKGEYMEDVKEAKSTSFIVGVAAYPETHRESVDMDSDMQNLKKKVDAGASFIITQMFFDNQVYFDFVERAREAGITIPIIPGLKIVTSKRQVEILPEIFHTKMPFELYKSIDECENNSEACEIGIKHAISQFKELEEYGVPCIHLFSMNNLSPITSLLKGVQRI